MENIVNSEIGNICGSIYKKGNLVFEKNRQVLYSPIGNRVVRYDLEKNKQEILNIESDSDIRLMEISDDNQILILVTELNNIFTINTRTKSIINRFNMGIENRIKAIKYSPDNVYLAVVVNNIVRIFYSPTELKSIEPFRLYRKYKVDHKIVYLNWMENSRFLLVGLKDYSVQLISLHHIENYNIIKFQGHKSRIMGAFDLDGSVFTISKDGYMYQFDFCEGMTTSFKRKQDFIRDQVDKKVKGHSNVNDLYEGQDQSQLLVDQKMESEKGDCEQYQYYSELERDIINDRGRFVLKDKYNIIELNKKVKIQSLDYNSSTQQIMVCKSDGSFVLGRMEKGEFIKLQNFNISSYKIDSCRMNSSGNWIGFGVQEIGQLIVWEWRSQNYILDQKGLYYETECVSVSSNGNTIASGTISGEVKLWDTKTQFCYQTFNSHTSKITGLQFINKNSQTLVSCSIDGYIKCYDCKNGRVFRSMVNPDQNQLMSLAIDCQGDIVCVGGYDPYVIYCYNIQTSQLLDALSVHDAPISKLVFSPINNILVSGSWDSCIRIHDMFSRQRNNESLNHNSEIMDIDFRQDGLQICVSILKGQLYFWNVQDAQIEAVIDVQSDIILGRSNDQIVKSNSLNNKHYKKVKYTADGQYIIAAGLSKYLNIYNISHRNLVRRILLSNNESLTNIHSKLNSKFVEDGVNVGNLERELVYSDSDNERNDLQNQDVLPGSKKLAHQKKKEQLQMECKDMQFDLTNNSFIVATTEGIFTYKQVQKHFTPYQLDSNITVDNLQRCYNEQEYMQTMIIAFQLNHFQLLKQIYLHMPQEQIEIVVNGLPETYLDSLLKLIAQMVEQTPDIHYHLLWLNAISIYFASSLQSAQLQTLSYLRQIYSVLLQKEKIINKTQYIHFILSNMFGYNCIDQLIELMKMEL